MTDATYWTGEVGNIPRRFLKNFVYFGTGRASRVRVLKVGVPLREVVAILATTLLHTAKIHLILAPHGSTSPFRLSSVRFLLSRVG